MGYSRRSRRPNPRSGSRRPARISGSRPGSTQCTKARTARSSSCWRAGSKSSRSSTASSAYLANACPSTIFGRYRSTLGTAFPERLSARAEPSRVMQIEASSVLRESPPRSEGGAQARRPGARAHRRAPGRRRRAAKPRVPWSDTAGTRPAPICAAFSIAIRSRSSGSRRTRATRPRPWGGELPADSDCPAIGAGGRHSSASVARRGRAAPGCRRERPAKYDRDRHRRRSGGLAAAVVRRVEGLRTIVIKRRLRGSQAGSSSDRRLPPAAGVSRRQSSAEARAAAGAAARRGDPRRDDRSLDPAARPSISTACVAESAFR